MLSKDYIEAKLKELKQERGRWLQQARHNPWPYVEEYIGVLERRIAAYENILPKAQPIIYGSKVSKWS